MCHPVRIPQRSQGAPEVPGSPTAHTALPAGSRLSGLRALLVIPSFEGGGAERAWVTLLRAFAGYPLSLQVARFRSGGVFESELPLVFPRHAVPATRGDPTVVLRLIRLIRAIRPDLVVSVLRYANVATLLAARLSRVRTRVIVNEQNHPEMELTQHAGAALKWRILRWTYPLADGVTAISRGIADALIRRVGLPPSRVRVIPNPIDVHAVAALAAGPCPHAWLAYPSPIPVLVAAGRLVAQKGFDTLLRAFRQVRDARGARLVILGTGPLEHALRALRDRLGLAADVDFPGFDPNPYPYFARAACLVVASRYEGFGNVIVEGMTCGTPVVATRCLSGPEEIITDGGTGLLVPVDDVGALSEAILRVLSDQSTAARLRAEGLARALEFSVDRIAARYLALFDEVLAMPADSRGRER